jgi:MoaA/NifB/PqqE/SkfB family radical SAM enzyme
MLKKVTPNISLNTNAVMLTGPMIDMLADAGVTSLKIGIDSLNHNETKPNITQSHFAGSKLVREIIEHANAKMDVTLNVVITQWNRQKLGSMVEFAAEANIRRVKMIELHDFDSRGMNDQMHRNFRTNSGRDVFQESLKRWTEKSKKKVEVVEKPELGLTTVYILEDDVTIWFYEDPCRTRSCGSMYTEIDAEGSLMVCPRYHIHSKTFASYEPDEEWFELFEAYQKMRCSEQNGTFEEEYRRQSAVCKEYPNAGRRHDDRGNGFYTEKLEKACHKV